MPHLRITHIMACLALLGLADSSYLTTQHYLGTPLRCGIGFDCTSVTTSVYATWFHIPVALFGAFYYLTLLVLLLLALEAKDAKAQALASAFTLIGFIASLWFVIVQAFVLQAWCQWCLVSAATSTALFFCGMWWLKEHVKTSSRGR